MEFVLVPAGKFVMGSPSRERGHSRDEPRRRLRLAKPFYLAKYEVTKEQWYAVMGTRPWQTEVEPHNSMRVGSGGRSPAVCVSWDDCQGFLRKLGTGFRLPTEAEWECACRAGSTTNYCFGDDVRLLKHYAWFLERQRDIGSASAVGTKSPNAWGLYNMHGNVFEWCQNLYVGVDSGGSYRGLRGGAFLCGADACRSANCGSSHKPDYRAFFLGFRPARSLP